MGWPCHFPHFCHVRFPFSLSTVFVLFSLLLFPFSLRYGAVVLFLKQILAIILARMHGARRRDFPSVLEAHGQGMGCEVCPALKSSRNHFEGCLTPSKQRAAPPLWAPNTGNPRPSTPVYNPPQILNVRSRFYVHISTPAETMNISIQWGKVRCQFFFRCQVSP